MMLAPSLRPYDKSWLAKDAMAGVAAGAVVIPQAMAYATVAGLSVEVGLYTCMVPMAVYALLGGSRTLSVSTTSTIAALTASTLLAAGVAASAGDPERALASLTLLVGLVLLLARLLKAGDLIDFISLATLTGIKIGVGLTVASGQLPALLGIPGDPTATNFFEHIRSAFDELDEISGATALFSAITLAAMLLVRRFVPRLPAPLLAVAGGILLVAVANLDEHGIALIAEVPRGLPHPVLPTADNLDQLLPGAFAIALMVTLETLAVARTVRRPSEPTIDSDEELFANSMSCSVGAFFQAMPSAGGFSQTAINQGAGARTQLSEFVTVVLAVGCALLLNGVLSDLPQATLACVVMVAVLGLISPGEMIRFWQLSRIEFWVAAVTAVGGLAFGLLAAVGIGVVLTLALVIVELNRLGVTELQPTVGTTVRDVQIAGPDTAPVPGLLIVRLDGPLYTANVRAVHRKVLSTVADREDVRVVVVDATSAGSGTLGVVEESIQLDRQLAAEGVELWISGLSEHANSLGAQLPRWDELIEAGRIHPTALAAFEHYSSEFPR